MRSLLAGPVVEVAPLLLGGTVVSNIGGEIVAVRIVEVEAYAGEGQDPASYAHRGPTPGSARMFGPPGVAFVRFLYGMHWCLNVVTSPPGTGAAVLLRAGSVVHGLEAVRRRRARPDDRVPADRDLGRGPARLTAALAVTGEQDGLDLLDGSGPLRLRLAPTSQERVEAGPRVGVGAAPSRPWRFWLADEPAVSAYRAGGRRRTR
jgi:DNA-3-methyladenine glycosylase